MGILLKGKTTEGKQERRNGILERRGRREVLGGGELSEEAAEWSVAMMIKGEELVIKT